MPITLLIIILISLGTICVAAGIVGRTVQARRMFCRNCSYEISHRMTTCSECGSRIAASSLDIAFALNHPRIAALTATVSLGKHKASRSLIASGAMLLTISAAVFAASLFSGANSRSWRALAPSSFLVTTLERAPTLAAAKPTITELQHRLAQGTLTPRLHARMEQRINDLTPATAIPTYAASTTRRRSNPSIALHISEPLRFNTTTKNSKSAIDSKPAIKFPEPPPTIRIIESWPIHTDHRSTATGDEFTFPRAASPQLLQSTPELIERMQAEMRAQGLQPPSVLREHDFEIRVPSFQRTGTIAPLYPGLSSPSSPTQRTANPTPSHRTDTQSSLAPRRINPNKL